MIKSLQQNSHQRNLKQKNSSIRLNKLNKKFNRIYISPREHQCNSLRIPKNPFLKQQHPENQHQCLRAFVQSKIGKASPINEKKKQDVIKRKHKRFNTQFFIKDIIKLPQRYQYSKQQASQKKILNISRPCRMKINNTQIGKVADKNKNNFSHINMSSDYSKIKKQKFVKNKSFATIQSLLCSEVSEKEKPVVFPDSNFEQFKTTKNTHTEKNNTPQLTKNKKYFNSKYPSKYKQIEKISKRNPLKIKTSYQKQQLKFINESIKKNLTTSLNPKLDKIFQLPSQKYVHVYVKNYKPIGQQITQKFKQIIYSSAFEIHRVSQISKEKIYFGEMRNGLYHGLGVMISQYEIRQGIWEFGFIVQGIVKNSFQYYKGGMKQNLKHGYGECVYEDGGLYQGEWKNNCKSGQGYLKHSNFEYLGQWESGLIDGKGVLKTYFSVYEGQFRKSFKEGLGKQSFQNGDHFEGSFEADYPEGQGKYYWKSGQYYTGIFCKGKRQGEAIFIAPGILQFKGHYKNDRPSGQGKVYYINGDEYVGLFFKGQRNGLGDLMCKNRKIVYSGDWVNDSLVYQFKQLK